MTPSAQDRLDRQFADHTTPHPTPSRATAVPSRATAASENEKTTAAPAQVSPDERDTAPLARPLARRGAIRIGLLGIAILGATLFLWLPVLRRAAPPRTAALPAAPAAATPDASTAANPATAAPAAAPTGRPRAHGRTDRPTRADAPRGAGPPPPAAAEPVPPAALVASRAASLRARSDAERARAPELAGDVWRRARARASDADTLTSHGRFSDAQAAWDSAARLFAQARTAADREAGRRAAVPSLAPTPAPPAPPTAPPATARPEATRIAAALPTSIPTASPAAAPHAANPAEEKIREVVHRYEVAQSTLDADLYSRLFPSVDHARIAGAFENLRSQTVEFEVRRIQIDPTGARADVSGYEKRVAQPRAGTELRSRR